MAVGKIYLTGLSIPAAASVNAAASAQQRSVSAAADRSVIPLIYGQVQATADVLNIIEHGTDPNAYLLQVMWCHECDSIGTPLLNGLALPAGAAFTNYTGAQTTADSAMVTAFAAKGITYTETLEGIAYSVLKLPTKEFTGELTVTADVRGRKVYDQRLDSTAGGTGLHRLADPATWEWSDNPSLCLADWIDNAVYGADDSVVWDSVPAAADANDALVGTGPTERRRTLNLAITDPVRIADMAEALRVYAGCWLVPTRYGLSLLPDADDASVATYSHASGHIAAIGSISTRDLSSSPTAVEVTYTDDSQVPSRDGVALALLPGAGSTLPWRQSSVRLPGINRYSQALREATERLNKLNLGAFSTTLDVFDIGIRHEVGDIITVSHPAGLVSALMRITESPQMPSIGHWRLPVTQHDPLAYDDAIATTPGYGDPGRIVAAGPPSDATGFSGSARQGLIRWRWEPCLDVDYGTSELRTSDSHWGDAAAFAPAFRGRVNEWQEQVTTPGVYTRYLRHYDKTELFSSSAASATVTVTEADVADAVGAASAAQDAADAAALAASNANAMLADIASDSLLTPDEKPRVIQDAAVITSEQAGIDAQATGYGITTEKAGYDAAFSSLTAYLAGLITPVAWDNLGGNTNIVGTTFRTNWANFYAARQTLLNKIANAAGTVATWAGVTGTGRPADNATRNVVSYGASAPGSPVDGDLWVDTSGTFAVFKLRSAGAWVTGANALSAYNALSGRPVALADINNTESTKLAGIADGATVNRMTYSASAPGSPVDGDVWVDTSGSPAVMKVRVSGAWQLGANLSTGALAMLNAVGMAQIVDESAAKLAESYSAGPLSRTTSGNYKTITITNPDTVSRWVIVHLNFTYTCTATGAGAAITLGYGDGGSSVFIENISLGASATKTGAHTLSGMFLLSAGATGYYSLWLQVNSGALSSSSTSGVNMRTELILK